MKRCSQVLFAAAGLALSLSLSGCGIPAFVIAFCKESLSVPLARAAADGLNTVQTSCGNTFVAQDKINMCIYEGQRILNDAKTKTMPDFAEKCGNYVDETICNSETSCYKHPDQMTPAQAREGIKQYIDEHGEALKVTMKDALDARIHEIVTADYNHKFSHRAIPLTVEAQCSNELDQSIGINRDVKNDVIMEVYRNCEIYPRGWHQNDCQTRALERLQKVEHREKANFKERCARSALAVACPKGSACGLETSGANTVVTQQAAVNFMLTQFGAWERQYKNRLMNAARTWHYGHWVGRKFGMFYVSDWQGNALLAMVSLGAAIAGVGCVVAVVRFARKGATTTRTITASHDTAEAMELIEDLEE